MLAKSSKESAGHVRIAAVSAGWVAEENPDLLDLGAATSLMSTMAEIDNLKAVVHIGHPAQPNSKIERVLLAANPQLVIKDAIAVTSQWMLVASSLEASAFAVVDEAGMRDCRYTLRKLGLSPHLVPNNTPLSERMALAGDRGALVLTQDQVPAGFQELPGANELKQDKLWFGLLERGEPDFTFTSPAQVWVAFGPDADHRGSLQQSLGIIADAGIDLSHLRSQPTSVGTAAFFSSFQCESGEVLKGLVSELVANRIENRVLAVIPGNSFLPGPDVLNPVWH